MDFKFGRHTPAVSGHMHTRSEVQQSHKNAFTLLFCKDSRVSCSFNSNMHMWLTVGYVHQTILITTSMKKGSTDHV